MPFSLHVSNDLTRLAGRLCTDMAAHGRGLGVMKSQLVITQTDGMSSWLKNTIAAQTGIASNIQFVQPADVVSRLEWIAAGINQRQDSFSKEEICWVVYSILDSPAFREKFPEVASYYDRDVIRMATLAQKVADLFDQYQIYRSDAITEWNNLTEEEIQNSEDWQPYLWRKLRDSFGDNAKDRTQIAGLIISKLTEPEVRDRILEKMPHLYIFGIAVVTPFFQKIFKALSGFVDIHMFLLNPAPEVYWLDYFSEKQLARFTGKYVNPLYEGNEPHGNDLLLNWGGIIKESFWLLFQDEELINRYDDSLSVAPENPANLLARLHYSIYKNLTFRDLQEGDEVVIGPQDHKDGSVTINGCYTPPREVEVLYNYFVSLVDKEGSDYSARDFLVMVPDIDLYAPYIHAVFGNSANRFRYSIADEQIASENNLFAALKALLEFDGLRFKAEEVMGMLDFPYIRRRFQFDDLDEIRNAIRQATVFFGLDGTNDDDSRKISWTTGLKKMIYGLCMQPDGGASYSDGVDLIPVLDTEEGAGGLDRIRLAYFLRVLRDKIEMRSTPRTLAGWADYLKELLEDMVFQAGERDDEDYPRFISLIEQLTDMKEAAQVTIPFDVFRTSFLSKLSVERRSTQFAGKGITFCSLLPMRSIPFRVVAMLGMNFEAFPRKETPVNFSLLSKHKKGDRNVKANDKHLFLETVLSAQEKLYISFQARSEKDGAALPPSILVDELIGFVARAQKKNPDKLTADWVTTHPLHGFSKRYGPDGLTSYLSPDRFRSRGDIRTGETRKSPLTDSANVGIQDIARFLENPPKTFLTKFFDIWYREDEMLLKDHEPFELGFFEGRELSDKLIRMEDGDFETIVRVQSDNGKLPLHNLGKATARILKEDLDPLRSEIKKWTEGWESGLLMVNVKYDNLQVSGQVTDILHSGNKLRMVRWTVSPAAHKHMLSGIVYYLGLAASGFPVEFVFIDFEGNANVCGRESISPEGAKERLQTLIEYYKGGLNEFFYFFPGLIGSIEGDTELSDILEKIEEARSRDAASSLKDPYFLKACDEGFASEETFEKLRENTQEMTLLINEFFPGTIKERHADN
jgi:exodeoxyribonuclease V gamma subunit